MPRASRTIVAKDSIEVLEAAFDPRSANKKMALELKGLCEKCGAAVTPSGVAYICSYECTFCQTCSEQTEFVCTNCGGELVRRPRRKKSTNSGDVGGA
jgi:hypothetical protein